MNLHARSVDVVIPVYNGANTISVAIESVIKQKGVSIENIYVINDGSVDNTLDVLTSLAIPNLKVITIKNGGVSNARNLGISLCSSEWIAFLDADDYWLESKLNHQLNLANIHQVDFVCCSVGNPNINDDSVITSNSFFKGNFIATSSVILRKRLAHSLMPVFNTKMTFAEDYDAWFRILSIARGYFCSEKFIHYEISATPHYKLNKVFLNILRLAIGGLGFIFGSNLPASKKLCLSFVLISGVLWSFLGILRRFLLARWFIKYEK